VDARHARVAVERYVAQVMTRSRLLATVLTVLGASVLMVGTPSAWADGPGPGHRSGVGHHAPANGRGPGDSSKHRPPKLHWPHKPHGPAHRQPTKAGHGRPLGGPQNPPPQTQQQSAPGAHATAAREQVVPLASFTVERRTSTPTGSARAGGSTPLANPRPAAPRTPASPSHVVIAAADKGSLLLAGPDGPLGLGASTFAALTMVGLAVFLVSRRGRLQLPWLASRTRRR
jgi:hypothetical protein